MTWQAKHTVSLCVWAGEILPNGECYNMTNVSVRQFSGETYITTTAQSKSTLLEDVDIEAQGVVNNLKVFERAPCHHRGESELFVSKATCFAECEPQNCNHKMPTVWGVL